MITPHPLVLLSESGFNEIALTFNAYLGFTGKSGGSIIHGQDAITFIVDDVNQFINESDYILPIQQGDTDTAMSAARLNHLIDGYNKIMQSAGGDGCNVHISEGGVVVEVML